MAAKKNTDIPAFTGRDVPISEIARATGKSENSIKRGLREGLLHFGVAMKSESGNQYSYFCPDKLVWEKIGYFNPAPDEQDRKEV